MFRFHQSRLQTKEKLGKGRFGTVFPYQKDPQDHKWVVKRIRAEDSDALMACLPEIVLGFACDHLCVVPVKGYYIEKSNDETFNIYMKLPRMKETLLSGFKERKRKDTPYSEQEIVRYFYSLVCGIGYLHSKKIYHGDIKPDNLLLDEDGNLKVADVGMAKHVEEEDSYQTLSAVGTYQYSDPEILGQKPTKEMLPKADIWSLGAVILELCVFDFRLLNASSPRDKLQNTLNELFKSLQGRFHPSLIALIQKLLDLDPQARPNIGQIKTELEKNFSQILDKELLSLGNGSLIQVDKGPEIKALNQQIREISGKYEDEVKRLKKSIVQLEEQLIQQKQQQEDRIKVLVGQNESKAREQNSKEKSENILLQKKIKGLEQELDQLKAERRGHTETISNTTQTIKSLEKQIQMLKQDNTSYEQKSKDLQRYLDTSIKEQMKAYEDQIKVLIESQLIEKTQFSQERKKLLEDLNALHLKVKEIEPKRESFGEDYDRNLKKAVLELRAKWNDWFSFEEKDRKLVISYGSRFRVDDEQVSELSKNLIEILDKHHLFNLFGLEINLSFREQLTDKALEYVATALSNPALYLQHLTLDFSCCFELTDKALEYVATALSNQALHLQHITLNFSLIPEISEVGVENLAAGIKDSCLNLQELWLDFSRANKVTAEKKESLRKRLAKIPKFYII